MKLASLVALTALSQSTLAQVSGQPTCYFANGTALPTTGEYSQFQACPGSNICCGLNRSNPANGDPMKGPTVDECLPNGLCQNRYTNNNYENVKYSVDFCTNSNVSGGGCLDVCQRTSYGIATMTPCNGTATSELWCCGDSDSCCTSGVGVVRLAQVLGGTQSSIVGSATGSSTGVPSPSSSNAAATGSSTPVSANASSMPTSTGASSPPSPDADSKLSGGAIAGIVIGALAGVALLAAAIFFARRAAMWKKKATEAEGAFAHTQHSNGYEQTAGYTALMNDKYPHAHQGELYGNGPTHELPGGVLGSELPSSAPKK